MKIIEVTFDGLETSENLEAGIHECPDGEKKRTFEWNGTDITEIVAGWSESPAKDRPMPPPESPGYERARKGKLADHQITLQLRVEDVDGLMEFLADGENDE
jgi:hypothetical protein